MMLSFKINFCYELLKNVSKRGHNTLNHPSGELYYL